MPKRKFNTQNGGSPPPKRTPMYRFTPGEVKAMKEHFNTGDYWPERQVHNEFGRQFCIDPLKVRIWFQNYRAKMKAIKTSEYSISCAKHEEKIKNSKAKANTSKPNSTPQSDDSHTSRVSQTCAEPHFDLSTMPFTFNWPLSPNNIAEFPADSPSPQFEYNDFEPRSYLQSYMTQKIKHEDQQERRRRQHKKKTQKQRESASQQNTPQPFQCQAMDTSSDTIQHYSSKSSEIAPENVSTHTTQQVTPLARYTQCEPFRVRPPFDFVQTNAMSLGQTTPEIAPQHQTSTTHANPVHWLTVPDKGSSVGLASTFCTTDVPTNIDTGLGPERHPFKIPEQSSRSTEWDTTLRIASHIVDKSIADISERLPDVTNSAGPLFGLNISGPSPTGVDGLGYPTRLQDSLVGDTCTLHSFRGAIRPPREVPQLLKQEKINLQRMQSMNNDLPTLDLTAFIRPSTIEQPGGNFESRWS